MSPRGWAVLLRGLSAVGYGLGVEVLLTHGIYSAGGAGAGDVFAYWTAGGHVLAGIPLYENMAGGYAAYEYPPLLAQTLAPLSLVPFVAFAWVWRLAEFVCLRYAVGSCRNTGLVMLLWPPVIAELDAGNVHLIVAGAIALLLRRSALGVVPAALTKFATLAALPLAFRLDRRGMAVGAILAAAACLLSFAVDPSAWISYGRFLVGAVEPNPGWYNLGQFIPLWVRLGMAGLLALASLRWARLAPVAVTLAYPVLWFHGLSTLVAVLASGRKGPMTGDGRPRAGLSEST